MNEKEYTVVVKKGIDLEAFDAELAASTGEGPIPNRTVDVADPRKGSKRQTHWMLTDEEANTLRTDPRVEAVEIPAQILGIPKERSAYQSGLFYRSYGNSSYTNWGLRRVTEATNVYNGGYTVEGDYEYALDGTGVDVVIQDSGIEPTHPEWNDSQGNSRLQQVDWYAISGLSGTQSANHYRDFSGHGTHVASTAAGLRYGWAKNAHIYSQKLYGLEGPGDDSPRTGIPDSAAFDSIRLWHLKKNDPTDPAYTGRPTIVNMSWGYTYRTNSLVSGVHQGNAWTYTSQTTSQIFAAYGFYYINPYYRLSLRIASVDVEIEEMIDAGIHVCISAGNNSTKLDVPGGVDYDNTVDAYWTAYDNSLNTLYPLRPSSPYDDRCLCVGSTDTNQTNNLDQTATYSNRGPAVNIWSPGTGIIAATSNTTDLGTYPVYDDPDYVGYQICGLSGTSMASPQICGLGALYLQARPNLTPDQLRTILINDSKKNVLYETTNNLDDYDTLNSILGSPNRHAFSRYGRQPLNLTTNSNIILTKP